MLRAGLDNQSRQDAILSLEAAAMQRQCFRMAVNSQAEARLKDNTEFVRKRNGDYEVIPTRAIIAEEEAIIGAVKAGIGKKAALIGEAEYGTPDELR